VHANRLVSSLLFRRSFGASWGVSMVMVQMESARGVGETSKWCKDLEEFYKCVILDSIAEFCLVCIAA
jgi:hypothetical protein